MMTTSSSAAAVATTTMVVNPVELIKQVIENIHAQLQPLDFEIGNASQGDSSYVCKNNVITTKFVNNWDSQS